MGLIPSAPSIPSIPSPQSAVGSLTGNLTQSGAKQGITGTTSGTTNDFVNPNTPLVVPGGAGGTPGKTIGVSDYFLQNYSINGTDWAQVYGYQMAVYDASLANKEIMSLSFPINPQNISIDVPTAVSTSVTMKGIVEEHNAAPLRRITIRGTSGVVPADSPDQSATGSGSQSALDYLFKNTIQAVSAVASQATALANTVSSVLGANNTTTPPLNIDPGDTSKFGANPTIMTGYWWIHSLIRFLDSYLAYKKAKKYAPYRLQFRMFKDKMYWDCTLNNYSIRKLPGTLEYEYEITLTAWRRSNTTAAVARQTTSVANNSSQTFNKIALAVQALTQAQNLIASSLEVLQGVNADIQNSFLTPMREAILFGSELVGAVESILQFPQSLINSAQASLYQALRDANQFNPNLASNVDQAVASSNIYPTSASPVSNASQLGTSAVRNALSQQDALGQSDLTPIPASGNPLETIFQNPNAYAPIFNQFPVDSLNLTAAQRAAVQNERDRVSAFDVQDLVARRTSIRSFMYATSLLFGGGNATYARIYNLPPPPTTTATLDTDSLLLLSQMNDIIQQLDSMINMLQNLPTAPTNDYYQYYSALALANGLTFSSNTSKFYIPMPYGGSLESLAAQYLGNSDRWIEIAALNGLRDPYIDEVGFNVPLLVNATNNVISVADSSQLFVGQAVQIQANNLQPTLAVISEIEIISDVQSYVTLAGEVDVTGYTVANGASIFAYLPDTVNSSQMIAIPSDTPVNVSGNIKLTPEPSDLTTLIQMAKVDFLLNSSGDVAVTSNGDVQLAVGVANLVQVANMKMQTEIGTIISNMGYGNSAQPGRSLADMSASDVLSQLQTAFNSDPRFGPLLAAQVNVAGPAVSVSLVVQISNTNVNLPVTTQLPF